MRDARLLYAEPMFLTMQVGYDLDLYYEIAMDDPQLVNVLETGVWQNTTILLQNLFATATCNDTSLVEFCINFQVSRRLHIQLTHINLNIT